MSMWSGPGLYQVMQIVNNLWENICLRDGQRQQTNANDEEKINADFHDSDKENKPPRED